MPYLNASVQNTCEKQGSYNLSKLSEPDILHPGSKDVPYPLGSGSFSHGSKLSFTLSSLIHTVYFVFLFCLYNLLTVPVFLADCLRELCQENTGCFTPTLDTARPKKHFLSLIVPIFPRSGSTLLRDHPVQGTGYSERATMGWFTRGGLAPSLCHSYSGCTGRRHF